MTKGKPLGKLVENLGQPGPRAIIADENRPCDANHATLNKRELNLLRIVQRLAVAD